MEDSMFRFVAVSIAVVFLFSCATLDDDVHDIIDLHEIAEIPDPDREPVEPGPDLARDDPDRLEPESEPASPHDAGEPVDAVTADRIDDELPRLTPSVPAAVSLPDPPPMPMLADETVIASADDAPTPSPAAGPEDDPDSVQDPEREQAPEGVTAAVTEPAPVPAPPTPQTEPLPAAPRTDPAPALAERRADEPAVAERPPTTAPPVRETAPPVAPAPPVAAVPVPPGHDDAVPDDRREIEAGVMTEVSLVFPGFGWVYAGAETAGNGRVEFLRSDRTDDGTVFVFRMTESGRYTLSFQRQDLTRGEFVDESVAVTATEVSPSETEPGSPAASDVDRPAEDPDRVAAPDPAPLDPRIVFDNALADGDAERAVAAVRDIPVATVGGADAVRLARLLEQNGDISGAIEYYELALARNQFGTDIAEILFALGTLYERDSDRRSIRRSHGYYLRLVSEYPFSRLRDDARRRAAYLERYFLTVR